MTSTQQPDAIIVGAGLAGLVAAYELIQAGRSVLVIDLQRGAASPRAEIAGFELPAAAVIVTSGGIGHNHEMVRRNRPVDRLGPPPVYMIPGVPAHVDERMLQITEDAGAHIVNRDRMWHYVEGIHNWNPIWPDHAIRIIPGPLWLDANGRRFPPPNFPGFDRPGRGVQAARLGFRRLGLPARSRSRAIAGRAAGRPIARQLGAPPRERVSPA